MIRLLLCISVLIIGSRGASAVLADQSPCIYNIKGLKSLDNYRVESVTHAYRETNALNCSLYNTRNHTYTLRVRQKNGVVEELDGFGCTSNTSYSYTVKGKPSTIIFSDPEEVAIFCAVPMDRTCENPFKPCPIEKYDVKFCPIYTEGTDGEAAKIECTQIKDVPSRWYIGRQFYDAEYFQSTVCKAKSGENEAGFYLILSDGKEVQLGYDDQCEFKSNKFGPLGLILLAIFLVPLVCFILIMSAILLYKKRKAKRIAAMSGAVPAGTSAVPTSTSAVPTSTSAVPTSTSAVPTSTSAVPTSTAAASDSDRT